MTSEIVVQYKVTFQDIFSFAVDYRVCYLSEVQYLSAKDAMDNGKIVVNNLVNHCRRQLIITSIQPINNQ